jgi:hypothetical protein
MRRHGRCGGARQWRNGGAARRASARADTRRDRRHGGRRLRVAGLLCGHRAAWALREQRPGLSYERFAASFDIYADYHADVGTPSYPSEADGWVWIDAPVQTWGRRKDGERFGSVGRVLMKRRSGAADWKIAP